jgi:hypothetical protein
MKEVLIEKFKEPKSPLFPLGESEILADGRRVKKLRNLGSCELCIDANNTYHFVEYFDETFEDPDELDDKGVLLKEGIKRVTRYARIKYSNNKHKNIDSLGNYIDFLLEVQKELKK